jgi:hypothetical protein
MTSWFSTTPKSAGERELDANPHKDWHKGLDGKRAIADMQWDIWIRDIERSDENNPIFNACLLGNPETLHLLLKSRHYCSAQKFGLDPILMASSVLEDGVSKRLCEMLLESQEACEESRKEPRGKYGYVACKYCALPSLDPPSPPAAEDSDVDIEADQE